MFFCHLIMFFHCCYTLNNVQLSVVSISLFLCFIKFFHELCNITLITINVVIILNILQDFFCFGFDFEPDFDFESDFDLGAGLSWGCASAGASSSTMTTSSSPSPPVSAASGLSSAS